MQFSVMRAVSPSAGVATWVLVLALIGAGSKAGLAPLHVWLPLAHPAAPSHVSALMSGVMTKVAVYGFIRIVFDLVGPTDWRWSVPVLVVGAATGLLGVMHALMEIDLKRVLAYSTVENIGLVFIGLGLALAFKGNDMGGAAALAMTAALLHALNHMLFKSLLFFGAGAMLTATGQRDMSRLGGLLNRMPATGLFMLVGCVAISALPPLNGFVSEWLILQAVLLGPQFPQWPLKLLALGGRRRDRAGRRAGGGLFRARVRHSLSRPAARRRGGGGAGGRPLLARRHGRARVFLSARRRIPGRDDRRAEARRADR